MSFEVIWHPPAAGDLLNITWQDAAWVVREVDKLAEDGTGDVREEGHLLSLHSAHLDALDAKGLWPRPRDPVSERDATRVRELWAKVKREFRSGGAR